ncbi:MAG: amidohydrolase family protein [Gemmatimonadales bacterium]
MRTIGRRSRATLGGVGLLLALAAGGERLAAQTVVVRAGRLVDVERGVVAAGQDILVQGDRIVRVAPSGPLPEGARLIDLSGATVYPGLIDLHTHLVGDIQSADPLGPMKRTEADDLLDGIRHARATVRAGFTTVRDVGTYRGLVDVRLRRAIDEGLIEGPRMSVAGAYLTAPGGGGEVTGDTTVAIPPEMRMGVGRGPEALAARAASLLEGGADFLKVIATGAVLTVGTEPGQPELDEAEIRAIVEQAARRGTYVTAHAHGAAGAANAIRASMLDREWLGSTRPRSP